MTILDKSRIIVVGGGAAGLTAAIMGARAGAPVLLLEKKDQLGRKLMITGKGRCNVTNAANDVEEIIANLPGNGRFLYGALRAFDHRQTMRFFEEELRLPLKVERGNRVFPESDRAADVVDAMAREMKRLKVDVQTGVSVTAVELDEDGQVAGVRTGQGTKIPGRAVIIATGGSTYPGTGSTGDGYRMAADLGLHVTTLRPSLVPLIAQEDWVKELQGLALKNVRVTLWDPRGKKLGEEFGEMLFTHFGLSGPIVLSLSKKATNYWEKSGKEREPLTIKINLKPALTPEQLDARIQRDFHEYLRKQYKNALGDLLPKSLIPVVIRLSKIDEDKFVHQITRQERHQLLETLTGMTVTVIGHRPMSEAIVTAGGVDIKEIDPKTMASKRVPGLFFAGEVVDVDGYTGGFNLQAAWSMGYVAGRAAAKLVNLPAGGV
ncbi:BaiN/RdsA family NAD(P)/FAD-dependent oxidoreductase [Heliobacterium mobile]|uniref:NAD(P)/FAD-dependent oxidoreductase n=1 Tax=Heliobacterium mobile TaxID=28064 RepID=UPI002E2733BB